MLRFFDSNTHNIVVVSYKPRSYDSCRGCVMETYKEDFQIGSFESSEEAAKRMAELSSVKLGTSEVGYEHTIIIRDEGTDEFGYSVESPLREEISNKFNKLVKEIQDKQEAAKLKEKAEKEQKEKERKELEEKVLYERLKTKFEPGKSNK